MWALVIVQIWWVRIWWSRNISLTKEKNNPLLCVPRVIPHGCIRQMRVSGDYGSNSSGVVPVHSYSWEDPRGAEDAHWDGKIGVLHNRYSLGLSYKEQASLRPYRVSMREPLTPVRRRSIATVTLLEECSLAATARGVRSMTPFPDVIHTTSKCSPPPSQQVTNNFSQKKRTPRRSAFVLAFLH